MFEREHTKQYLTVLSVEILCETRGHLLPDPHHDAVRAILYSVRSEE